MAKKISIEEQRSRDARKEIIRLIAEDLLGYRKGQPFPTLITRKLKDFEFYPNEVILKTLEEVKDSLLYQFSQSGKFKNDQGKIFYLFAVTNNHINDIYRLWKLEQQNEIVRNRQVLDVELCASDLESIGNSNIRRPKDLSDFLEGDVL